MSTPLSTKINNLKLNHYKSNRYTINLGLMCKYLITDKKQRIRVVFLFRNQSNNTLI